VTGVSRCVSQNVNTTSNSVAVGFSYVVVMFVSSVTQTIVLHQYFFRMFRLGMNLRSAVIVAVYDKATTLSLTARQSRSVGQIVNLMSTDAQRLQDLTTYLQVHVAAHVSVPGCVAVCGCVWLCVAVHRAARVCHIAAVRLRVKVYVYACGVAVWLCC
jgi:hypothetical protein